MDKDIGVTVAIATHEIAGVRREGNISSVAADARIVAAVVTLVAKIVHAYALDIVYQTVIDKDIIFAVGVPTDEIAGEGLEGNEAAAGAYAGEPAATVPLNTQVTQTHPFNGIAAPVIDKDVRPSIRIPADKISGLGFESHVKPVSTDARVYAVVVALKPDTIHAYPFRYVRSTVAHKNIVLTVVVSHHQVLRQGVESNVLPTIADLGAIEIEHVEMAVAVPSIPPVVHADLLNSVRLPIIDVNIPIRRIPTNEIPGIGYECEITPIGVDIRVAAPIVPFLTGAIQAHPFDLVSP